MIKIVILDSNKYDGVVATHIEAGADMDNSYTKKDYKIVFDDFFTEASSADLIFVDFGELASLVNPDSLFDNYRKMINFLEEHPGKNVYFCLTMSSDFYEGYEDMWAYPNAIQINYSESPYTQRNLVREQVTKNG